MKNGHKVTVQLEVFDEDAEGLAEWFPAIPRESALMLIDEQIRRAEGSLRGLQAMRAIIAKASSYERADPSGSVSKP